mmetsp:Transcript_3280/g.7130  ORF Transcript_3280/g.7130 Transcript_3280/m.7130 type:complete len:107 (+) Transcript_3280:67-387(+)
MCHVMIISWFPYCPGQSRKLPPSKLKVIHEGIWKIQTADRNIFIASCALWKFWASFVTSKIKDEMCEDRVSGHVEFDLLGHRLGSDCNCHQGIAGIAQTCKFAPST